MNQLQFFNWIGEKQLLSIEQVVGKTIDKVWESKVLVLTFTDGTFISLLAGWDANERDIIEIAGHIDSGVTPRVALHLGIIDEQQFADLEEKKRGRERRYRARQKEQRRELLKTLKKEFGEAD